MSARKTFLLVEDDGFDVEFAQNTLGANSCLIKPVNWEDFRDRIRALGIYWSAHVATPESLSP